MLDKILEYLILKKIKQICKNTDLKFNKKDLKEKYTLHGLISYCDKLLDYECEIF